MCMKKYAILTIGTLLIACTNSTETPFIEQDDSTSSVPAVIAPPKEYEEPKPYTGPFHETENGEMIGTITLTGYPVREEVCNDDDWDEPCETYATYVFFRITGGMTPAMEKFLTNHEGNSFVREGAIGLGCETNLKKNPSMAPVLAATAGSPISITLNRPFEPGGRGAPSCHSHFDILSVAD